MTRTLSVLAGLLAATSLGAQNPPRPLPVQPIVPKTSWVVSPQPDPFAACMFAPEEVMAHQQDIALTDDQRNKLIAEMSRAQAKATETQWTLSAEQGKLQKLVQPAVVDEAAALKQVDRILAIEQDMKRAQMTLMVRVKNTLTAQQQATLRGRSGRFLVRAQGDSGEVLVRGDSVVWNVRNQRLNLDTARAAQFFRTTRGC